MTLTRIVVALALALASLGPANAEQRSPAEEWQRLQQQLQNYLWPHRGGVALPPAPPVRPAPVPFPDEPAPPVASEPQIEPAPAPDLSDGDLSPIDPSLFPVEPPAAVVPVEPLPKPKPRAEPPKAKPKPPQQKSEPAKPEIKGCLVGTRIFGVLITCNLICREAMGGTPKPAGTTQCQEDEAKACIRRLCPEVLKK